MVECVTIEEIKLWLAEQLDESGAKGFVVGLSGGIDSAVVATLCKSICDETLGVIMPCHSNPKDKEDALLLAKKFNISTTEVDLTETYDILKVALKDERVFPTIQPLDLANIKPRLRMTTLYYFANKNNYLVVGTGNKSEEEMGYFTKYGDGACDILPIADLLKDEIYALGFILELPSEILDKEPSAGLWDNQTDENEMGMTYEQIGKVIRAREKSEHKRNPPRVFKR